MTCDIAITNVNVTGRLHDVSLTVAAGTKLGIMGRSGAGKTSLISLLTGQLRPTTGKVSAPTLSEVGYIPQNPGATLIPHLPVVESILEPQVIALNCISTATGAGRPSRTERAKRRVDLALLRGRIPELLAGMGLEPQLAQRTPEELSGGQRQRIAIARALLGSPELIIADEAFSALDARNARLLEDLLATTPATVMFISHDIPALLRMSTHIAVIDQGRVAYTGLASDLEHLDETTAATAPEAVSLMRAAAQLGGLP